MKKIRIVNLSNRQLMIANEILNPKSSINVPNDISMIERARIDSLSAVGVIRAFEVEVDIDNVIKEQEVVDMDNVESEPKTTTPKRTRKTTSKEK